MLILMLCKREIKSNERQFEAFIRSHIDAKIFDLPYKCEGFSRAIDKNSESFKKFKRIMDKRNHTIHGNIDPEREKIETVYFEGKRPLFEESGDHIGKFFEALERRWNPQSVIKDYEDVYAFLLDIAGCLKPGMEKKFWAIMQNPYPGYDVNRKITGMLFNDAVFNSYMGGLRYDDELEV